MPLLTSKSSFFYLIKITFSPSVFQKHKSIIKSLNLTHATCFLKLVHLKDEEQESKRIQLTSCST